MTSSYAHGGPVLVCIAALCGWAWYRSISLWLVLRNTSATTTPDSWVGDLQHHAMRRSWHQPLPLIATLAGAAPLLGLLGTVAGIMETFDALAEASGAVMAQRMAAGISGALITTQAGLVTALPLLFMHRALRRRIPVAPRSAADAWPWRYRHRNGVP